MNNFSPVHLYQYNTTASAAVFFVAMIDKHVAGPVSVREVVASDVIAIAVSVKVTPEMRVVEHILQQVNFVLVRLPGYQACPCF